jgi:hypothetical protein
MAGFVIFSRTRASTSDIDYYRPSRGPRRVRGGMGSHSRPKCETRRAGGDGELGRCTAGAGALRRIRIFKTTARRVFSARACLPRTGRDGLPRLWRAGNGGNASRSRRPLGKCGMAVRWCADWERDEPGFCFESGVGESAEVAVNRAKAADCGSFLRKPAGFPDRRKETASRDGLREESDRPRVLGFAAISRRVVRGDEDGRATCAHGDKSLAQAEAGKTRQVNIQDQTSGMVSRPGGQQRLGGRERLDPKALRVQKSLKGLADTCIIFHQDNCPF